MLEKIKNLFSVKEELIVGFDFSSFSDQNLKDYLDIIIEKINDKSKEITFDHKNRRLAARDAVVKELDKRGI